MTVGLRLSISSVNLPHTQKFTFSTRFLYDEDHQFPSPTHPPLLPFLSFHPSTPSMFFAIESICWRKDVCVCVVCVCGVCVCVCVCMCVWGEGEGGQARSYPRHPSSSSTSSPSPILSHPAPARPVVQVSYSRMHCIWLLMPTTSLS